MDGDVDGKNKLDQLSRKSSAKIDGGTRSPQDFVDERKEKWRQEIGDIEQE